MFGSFWLARIGQQYFDGEGGGAGGGAPAAPAGGGGEGAGGGSSIGPSSTQGIIQASLAGGGGGTEDGDDTGGETASTAEPEVKAKSPEEATEEAELEKAMDELRAKNPKLQGRIDVARHQAVLTRQRAQAQKLYDAKVAEYEAQMKELSWAKDPETKAALKALDLVDQDPEKFLEILKNADPRYQKLLTPQQQAQLEAQTPSDMPGPDQVTEDGQKYYSHEGLDKRMAWERKQAAKEAQAESDKKYGHLLEKEKAEALYKQSVQKTRSYLDTARETWPAFKEHEGAMKAAMLKDEKLSLDDAYRQVVMKSAVEQRTVNEAEMRKKLLEEMNKKPAAVDGTAPGRGVETKSDASAPKSTADLIRQSLRLSGGA